jgi:O-methyltransferase
MINNSEIQQRIQQQLEEAIVRDFIDGNYGGGYGITRELKTDLVQRLYNNVKYIETATSPIYHVHLAKEIMQLNPADKGAVIECGCFKGGSTAALSLICRLVGRKLIVCDSFEGLPDDETDVVRNYPHLQVFGYTDKGMYAGRFEEVQMNIIRFGSIENCTFIRGFFNESLKSLNEPIAFAFLDVDLLSSIKDCLKYIWPLLSNNGLLYTDDSCDMEVVKIWFDDAWWQENFGIPSPGYVGTGCGLPLHVKICSLGYTRKVSDISSSYGRIQWLRYRDK